MTVSFGPITAVHGRPRLRQGCTSLLRDRSRVGARLLLGCLLRRLLLELLSLVSQAELGDVSLNTGSSERGLPELLTISGMAACLRKSYGSFGSTCMPEGR